MCIAGYCLKYSLKFTYYNFLFLGPCTIYFIFLVLLFLPGRRSTVVLESFLLLVVSFKPHDGVEVNVLVLRMFFLGSRMKCFILLLLFPGSQSAIVSTGES